MKKNLSIKISEELLKKLHEKARAADQTLAGYVKQILVAAVNETHK